MCNIDCNRRCSRGLWLAATLLGSLPAIAAARDTPLEAALHYFTRFDPAGAVAALEQARPPALSVETRRAVLAALPPEGEVRNLSAGQRRKLAGIDRVLALHRPEGTYEIKVVHAVQASLGLHARTVVLISERALDLLDAEEIQALAAHEIGHDYFWAEYRDARRQRDGARLQKLELLCDGIAVITLRRVGLDPARLISGLERLSWYNAETLGAARNEDDYPGLDVRKKLVRALVRWLSGGTPD